MLNDTQRNWLIEKELQIRNRYPIMSVNDPEDGDRLVRDITALTKAAKNDPDVEEFFLNMLKYYERQYYTLMGGRK